MRLGSSGEKKCEYFTRSSVNTTSTTASVTPFAIKLEISDWKLFTSFPVAVLLLLLLLLVADMTRPHAAHATSALRLF
jgi:hypothetical protein